MDSALRGRLPHQPRIQHAYVHLRGMTHIRPTNPNRTAARRASGVSEVFDRAQISPYCPSASTGGDGLEKSRGVSTLKPSIHGDLVLERLISFRAAAFGCASIQLVNLAITVEPITRAVLSGRDPSSGRVGVTSIFGWVMLPSLFFWRLTTRPRRFRIASAKHARPHRWPRSLGSCPHRLHRRLMATADGARRYHHPLEDRHRRLHGGGTELPRPRVP